MLYGQVQRNLVNHLINTLPRKVPNKRRMPENKNRSCITHYSLLWKYIEEQITERIGFEVLVYIKEMCGTEE